MCDNMRGKRKKTIFLFLRKLVFYLNGCKHVFSLRPHLPHDVLDGVLDPGDAGRRAAGDLPQRPAALLAVHLPRLAAGERGRGRSAQPRRLLFINTCSDHTLLPLCLCLERAALGRLLRAQVPGGGAAVDRRRGHGLLAEVQRAARPHLQPPRGRGGLQRKHKH